MPLKDVAPRAVLKHGKVTVYNTYRHDILNDPSDYIFTTNSYNTDRDSDCVDHFDIRDIASELKGLWIELFPMPEPEDPKGRIELMKYAIDYGLIPFDPALAELSNIVDPAFLYRKGLKLNALKERRRESLADRVVRALECAEKAGDPERTLNDVILILKGE